MRKIRKVAYFNYMHDLYGSSIGSTIKAIELLTHLEQYGYKIFFYWDGEKVVFTGGAAKEKKSRLKSFIRRIFYTPKEVVVNFLNMRKEFKFLKSCHPDLIIVRVDAYKYSSSLLAFLLNIPLLIEADGANSWEWLQFSNKDGNLWKPWVLFFERFCFRVSKGIFVQSNVARDYYLNLYNLPKDKIKVITNAANLRETDTNSIETRRILGIPANSMVCGFIGSLHYWHNTGLLFELLRDLLPEYPHLYFLIVGGGGPMSASFQAQCEKFEWKKRVIFPGFVEHKDTHLYINCFNIALAPYAKSDMFYYSPVKVFEYMAQGIAMITTQVGQIGELVRDGENGLFFDPDIDNDLQKKVKYLLDHPANQRRLGENARETIKNTHTWSNKARQLDELCCNALKF